ncbi:FKBP-type peptidyl-prolyl cis-trans isomerase [Mucilaginibacter panaciglaebae]|uniref:Peptidyl-prolyl cis-trans isomerase n=1 Tax=Mucilaginibacter panaciglaebae TaxID=502331 RepID=A0ABP7WM02_9SPHI
MRQITYTLLFFGLIALVACRRNNYDPTINQYDDDQIKAYMSSGGLSGFTRDTSGIYYKILNPGRDTALQYTSNVSMVFTVKSVDGKYASNDTITNHYDGYLGHISTATSPLGLDIPGLQQAVHNIIKHNGGIARLIIPSKLAYGVSGAGVGSSSNTSGRIAGNQSLDYYVHLIGDTVAQEAYDQLVIKNYIAQNGLTMQQDPDDHYWYSIDEPGTGTVPITYQSSIIISFTTLLLDGTIASQSNNAPYASFDIPDMIPGVQKALKKYGRAGALMTFLFPSRLAYGKLTTSIPPNSVIKYAVRVISVSP